MEQERFILPGHNDSLPVLGIYNKYDILFCS